MKKSGSPSFYERLLKRTGSLYPIIMLLIGHLVNSPILLLLTAMPAQQNAGFNPTQGRNLLIFGGITLAFRIIILLLLFYFTNRQIFKRLSLLTQSQKTKTNPELEERAWKQANLASKRFIFFEFAGFHLLSLAPTLFYGYFNQGLEIMQIIHLSLSAEAANIVGLILGTLAFDQWFEPVMSILLPRKFENQLSGFRGMRLWVKLSFATLGLVLLGLLLTVPTAYHQVNFVFSDTRRSPQLVQDALLLIINSGIGAIVVGIVLSMLLAAYLSKPFRRMIKLFRDVETGDLSRRIDVTLPNEFGEVNVYLNHMIDRLQILTSNLEQQVIERTDQLSQANEQLAYTALHDPLTDLPNRVLFMDRLQHAMERAKRHKENSFAVFFLDLDRFKVVNDSLGHNIGDLLLIESAKRLLSSVRSEDSVARFGGDEFVILLEDMKSTDDYLQVAKRILHKLALPADLEGRKAFVSVSLGIVFYDERYADPEDILRDADIAMYQAKRQGRGRYEIFDPEMLSHVMTHLELESDLRKALDNGEFIIYYQPILAMEMSRIIGFEALLRWMHPSRGLIQPADFIPTAEEIGLMIPIGYWVLDEACRQLRIWQDKYPADPPLSMNVNLSTKQCSDPELIHRIIDILKKHELEASCLKLELTESLIVEDTDFIASILQNLRELGIQVQIDDFGTGYSSLGYLHTLPIETLKIDRTFISQLGESSNGLEIVRTILALAHSLGMHVIAEGVETKEQLQKLKKLNCEYVQGFYFSEPVDKKYVDKLLRKSS